MELYAAVIRRRDWLDGKRGKAEGHGNADGDLGECALRDSQQDKRQQQQAKSNRSTHYAPLHLLILFHRPLRIRAAARTLIWATFRTTFDFYASESRRGCSASKPWPTRDGGSEI